MKNMLTIRFIISYMREFVLIVAGGFIGAIISLYGSGNASWTQTSFLVIFYGAIFIIILIMMDFIDHLLNTGVKYFKKHYREI